MVAGPIKRESLLLGEELGKGGQGHVFAVTASAFGRAVAYKEYRPDAGIDADTLARMVTMLDHLAEPELNDWLDRFAWPLAVVETAGLASGFVMPQVPDRYRTDFGSGTRRRRIVAAFQHLLNPPDFVARNGVTVDRRRQYELLAHLAQSLTILHDHGIAVGDLSPMNLLFDVSGETASVYFLDCDAMQYDDEPRDDQVETPGWGVPVGDADREPLATAASDAYKFGLLALRLLAGSQDSTAIADLPDDSGTVRPLIERSLSSDPALRPAPRDWVPTLRLAAQKAARADASAGQPLPDERYPCDAAERRHMSRVTHRSKESDVHRENRGIRSKSDMPKPLLWTDVVVPQAPTTQTGSATTSVTERVQPSPRQRTLPSTSATPKTTKRKKKDKNRKKSQSPKPAPALPVALRDRLGSPPARSDLTVELRHDIDTYERRNKFRAVTLIIAVLSTWAGFSVASAGYEQQNDGVTHQFTGSEMAAIAGALLLVALLAWIRWGIAKWGGPDARTYVVSRHWYELLCYDDVEDVQIEGDPKGLSVYIVLDNDYSVYPFDATDLQPFPRPAVDRVREAQRELAEALDRRRVYFYAPDGTPLDS